MVSAIDLFCTLAIAAIGITIMRIRMKIHIHKGIGPIFFLILLSLVEALQDWVGRTGVAIVMVAEEELGMRGY